MNSERIILSEHKQLTAELSDQEATALRSTFGNKLGINSQGDGRYTLKAQSWAGVATLPGGRTVSVEPKVSIDTIFALITEVYGGIKNPFRDEPFDYNTVDGLFEFVVHIFLLHLEDLLARGLLRGYQKFTDNPVAIRGRLLVAETLRRNPGLHDRHWCSHSRFTADVPENRILLWAVHVLEAHRYRNTSIAPRLRHVRMSIGMVPLDPNAPHLFERLVYHRLNYHYHAALAMARLLLDHLVYSGNAGMQTFLAFLIDMNSLFEKYLASVLQKYLVKHGITLQEQGPYRLDSNGDVRLRPDITLLRNGKPFLVIDAKYKLKENNEDVYQMVAYCHGLGIHDSILVYPASEGVKARTLNVHGPGNYRISYLPIYLGGTPEHLSIETERLAQAVLHLERSTPYSEIPL